MEKIFGREDGALVQKFYEAALRHFVDAQILEREECYDNAVYLYGNAAECALKAMLENYCRPGNFNNRNYPNPRNPLSSEAVLKNGYGHFIDSLAKDMNNFIVNSSVVAILDPSLALKQQAFIIPEVLSRDHPERRYAGNGIYTLADAQECEKVTHVLVDEMIKQHLDGYIS